MFAMSSRIAGQATEANDAMNVKDPSLGWMIGFLFLVCFVGLFALVPLRKVMIIDYGLSYPSGTATATLINGFHTPQGAKEANFLWGLFKWFYTAGDDCGFESFPSLGLEAYERKFYFSFSPIYVGVGMICPYIINVSILLGGILSWGLMWPLIEKKKGSWYPATAKGSDLHGLQGYKVFISIAMILGDGFYNFVKVSLRMTKAFMAAAKRRSTLPVSGSSDGPARSLDDDDLRRTEYFLRDQIPMGVALAGYVAVAAVSVGVAVVYRNMAIFGVQGFSSLPKHCLTLCCVVFAAAVVINLARDLAPEKVSRFIPVPMAMAIPFYLGSYFAIDMCVGSAILFVWEKVDKAGADMFARSVASGLICGEGIWSMPQSVLALAKVQPPICMKFLSRSTNARVDAFIQTLSSKT
uniref:Metal-nicotianamine transporter YSL7 n=1 Tax=Aegilops tauschii subsp. strangulata TaxID=200361 RepID=A0A453P515_AEGTS